MCSGSPSRSRSGTGPASIRLEALQSVRLKFPFARSFLKKSIPGMMLLSEPPSFSAAAHTAESAGPAETGLPLSATRLCTSAVRVAAQVVGQAFTMLRSQPNEMYPP